MKLLGKSIGYQLLWTRIHALWNPVGEIKIVDLDNEIFIVKLNSYKDYLNALTGGPWVILGHYLTVQSCNSSFNAAETTIDSVVAWFGFQACRSNTTINLFYNVLRTISGVMGNFVRVEYNTREAQHGRFMRVAVEINLSKPLISHFTIDVHVQSVEY